MSVKKKKINKILVANRGEVAIRIMKTAKKLGVKTVAIHSDADKLAYFTTMADEVYHIEGNLPRESYANLEKVLLAIKETGADAVHPGYGFLAENSEFASRVEDMGVSFIGPSSNSIRIMGDKVSAKLAAKNANISVAPGFIGAIENRDKLKEVVNGIGFPVIMKAAAGGGGKGMRIVREWSEVDISFEMCVNEAAKNFNDDRVFIEKYIENPRHIEIQVLGDKYGSIVCLGERECSIQRFNNKIIEEAPSVFVDEKMRQNMYKECVSLVKECGYYSAGTVEYIVDSDKNFYFLEMNTRLQVEHGVTEMITGVDIVEQMIRVEEGEKLPFKQEDIKLKGWAIESRVYAEDTSKGFVPSSGRITKYVMPEEKYNLRIETNYKHSGYVSPYYDAMIAKVLTYGDIRSEAISKMRKVLSNCLIDGIKTNLFMLEAIMMHSAFKSGDISTNFVAQYYPNGFKGLELGSNMDLFFVVASSILNYMYEKKFSNTFNALKFIPNNLSEDVLNDVCVVLEDGRKYSVRIVESCQDSKNCSSNEISSGKSDNSSGFVKNLKDDDFGMPKVDTEGSFFRFKLNINGGDDISVEMLKINNRMASITIVTKEKTAASEVIRFRMLGSGKYEVSVSATTMTQMVCRHYAGDMLQYMKKIDPFAFQKNILSPVTGIITLIKVKEGDQVRVGDRICHIEAMKMENVISAECNGIVSKILRNVNDVVSAGDSLVELRPVE